MSNIYRVSIISVLLFGFVFSPFGEAMAVVTFRNPLNTYLSPPISAWFDHDSGSGTTKRYDCSTGKPYDGHRGIDFPANRGTSIYAGASGSLYYRIDGCKEQSVMPNCGGWGNHVRIDHEGKGDDGVGMVSIYAHMDIRTPAWYQCLKCSAFIGRTGNSGNTSGPHLHFEIRPKGIGYAAVDPSKGNCSQATSYWNKQGTTGLPSTSCTTYQFPAPVIPTCQ